MTQNASLGRGRLLVGLLGLVMAACSPSTVASPSPAASVAAVATASAAPTASPTASPTPSPTASPTSSPTPAPTATPTAPPDAAEGLSIGKPYTLAPLNPILEASMRQQIVGAAGPVASLIGFGGRDVNKNGATAGYVFVIDFPAGLLNDSSYQSLIAGVEANSSTTFKTAKISGVSVSTGAVANGFLGLYRKGDRVVMVITPTAVELTAVTKALIAANN
jgi:hypothetical protein